MQKLIWQNANGEELNLTSGNYGITNWEGFSNTSLNIQSQQVPFQDGSVFLDALIEQRELSVTLAMQDNGNLEERYEMRRELIHILNPKLGEGYLIYSNDFISKRIKCIPQIPLFENHNSNDSGTPKASLSWTACEPYWEDLEEITVAIEKGERKSIVNNGDVSCGVNIYLQTGYIQEPFIKNITQSKTVKLNGAFNDDILIDTNVGKKTIIQEQLEFKLRDMGMQLTQIAFSPLLNIIIIANSFGGDNNPDYGGKSGLISNDGGETWAPFRNIKSVYWCKEKSAFIACECLGEFSYQIIMSEDGKNWDVVYTMTYVIGQFIYNPITNQLLAIGSNMLYTSDLENWSISTVGYGSYYCNYSVLIQPDGTILGIGSDGIYRGNLEGRTKVLNANMDYYRSCICYSSAYSRYLASSYHKLYSSYNGVDWVEILDLGNINIQCVKCENGKFIMSAGSDIYISEDAEEWRIVNYDSFFDCIYIEDYGVYLIAGYDSLFYTTDLMTFSYIFKGGIGNVMALKYNSILGFYVAVISRTSDYYTTILKSEDLQNWTILYTDGLSRFTDIIINPIDGSMVAIGIRICYSVNGSNWILVYDGGDGSVKGLYSNDLHKFIIVSSNYYIQGEDSNSRIIILDPTDLDYPTIIDVENTYSIETWLKDIIFNPEEEKFVVIGEHSGYCGKSTDGVNWTFTQTVESSSADGYQVSLMVYSNKLNKYIGIKDKNIGQSVDAINWTKNSVFSFTENIKAIIETDKFGLVVVGENGYMASSYNGNEWIEIETNLEMTIFTVEYLREFLVGSEFSIILESQRVEQRNIIASLSTNSDMTLGLDVGENNILFNAGGGNASCTISYRQKYIGV